MGVKNATVAPVESTPNRVDRALAGSALGFIAAMPFVPDWPRLVLERPTPLFPLACLAAIALSYGLLMPSTRRSWWAWIAAAPFLIFSAVYLLTLFVFVAEASAWVFAALAWPVGAWAFVRANRLLGAMVWHLAWVVAAACVVARHTFGAPVAIVAASVYGVLAVTLALRPRAVAMIGGPWWAFHAFTVLVYAAAYLFHQGVDPSAIDRVTAQLGVRAIVAFSDADRLARRVGDDIMMAIPAGSGAILGPHDPERNLRRITVGDAGKPDVQSVLLGHRTGDNAVPNPAQPGHWFLGAPGRVIEIREEPFDLVRSIDVPGGLVNFVRDAGPERGLIVSRDNGRSVVRVGLSDGLIDESDRLGPFRRIFDVAYDAATDRYLAVCVDPAGTALVAGPAATMAATREVRIPGSFGFLGDIDVAGRRYFLASFHTGEVVTVDLDSFEVRERTFIGGSPRNATFDAARGILYVSDYFGGQIVVLRPETREIIARIATGPRPRQTTLSADGQTLALRSAAGVIAVDLNAALADAKPASPPQETTLANAGSAVRVAAIRVLMPAFVAMRAMGE